MWNKYERKHYAGIKKKKYKYNLAWLDYVKSYKVIQLEKIYMYTHVYINTGKNQKLHTKMLTVVEL